MKKITILFFLLLCFNGVGWSQPNQPTTGVHRCIIPFYITATGSHFPSTTGYDNRQDGCSNWIIYYSNIGFSAVSLLVESAPAATANAPGTYVSFAGTTVTGANPGTSTTQCGTSCYSATGYFPWVRGTATLTGSGTLVGVLLGDPTPSSNIAPIAVTITGTVQEQLVGNGTVISGQQSVTGSAVALASNSSRAACVKALVSNSINVFVGPSGITTSTGYLLAPGEGVCFAVTNTNLLFVIASTTGASVSWTATN